MKHPVPTGERKLPEWRVSCYLFTHSPDQPVDYLLTRTMVRARQEALRLHPQALMTRRTLKAVPHQGLRQYVYAEYYHLTEDLPCACETCTGEAPDLAGPHWKGCYGPGINL